MAGEVIEKKLRWIVVSIVSLAIIFGLASLWYHQTDIPQTAAMYGKNLGLAKAAGLPFTHEEAAQLRQVPDEENAYFLVSNLEELDFPVGDVESDLPDLRMKWKSLEPSLPRLIAASQKKYLMFPETSYNPAEVAPNGPFRLAQWIIALCWRADVAASNHDTNMTANLLFASARLSILLDQDPDFRLQALRAETASSIDNFLAILIAKHGGDIGIQKVIAHTLEIMDKPYDLRRSYRYEHWTDLQRVKLGTGEREAPTKETELLGERFIPKYSQANKSRVHEMYAEMVSAYPANIQDYAAVERLNDQCFRVFLQGSQSASAFGDPIYRYADGIRAIRGEVAKRNALTVALYGEQKPSRVSHASIDLGSKGQDIDGKPIRIKKQGRAWIVYSIGTNLSDEGGAHRRFNSPDFVVHLSPVTAIPPSITLKQSLQAN